MTDYDQCVRMFDTTIEMWGIENDEFKNRVGKIRAKMQEQSLDLLILYSDTWRITDVGYVTNYRPLYGPGPSSMWVLLPVDDEPVLLTNDVHIDLAKDQQWIQDVRPQNKLGEALKDIHNKYKPKKVGLDGWGKLLVPVSKYDIIIEELKDAKIEETSIVTNMRLIKSENEIEILKEVGRINDEATLAAFEALEPGIREYELAGIAADVIFSQGGQLDLDTVWIASGENSGYNIHRPGSRKIQEGDIIHIDAAPRFKGYCSDADRTFIFGEEQVPEEGKNMYYAAIDGLDAGLNKVEAGTKISEVANAVRQSLIEDGFSEYLSEGHAFGHGIGIDMVEPPTTSPDDQTVLKENMTFTITSRLMKPRSYGVLFEDVIQVKENGYNIIQGDIPRELII